MSRMLIAGLALSVLALAPLGSAEARGFRFSFRSRLATPVRTPPPFAERKSSTILLFRKPGDDRPEAAQKATAPDGILGAIGQDRALYTPYKPAPVTAAAAAKKSATPSAHWCDNGTVVGTGSGFCVLKAGGGTAS